MDYRYLSTADQKAWFVRFAEKECAGVSPFYESLARAVAAKPELLELAAHCRKGQPMPNLFFAAVHYLLLADPQHELANYYPSLNGFTDRSLPFELFTTFCREHAPAIIRIEQERIVQTNAINRAAYLLPIILSLFSKGTSINIVDIGTSAGLTLNFDHYAYRYRNGKSFGRSPVLIESELRGGALPKIQPSVRINRKTGIDQNPLDLTVPANARWLQALIWPDRRERFERIEKAIELAKTARIELIKGQSIDDFRRVLLAQEAEMPLVVYHTHVLYQFPPEERTAFWKMLDEVATQRQLYYIAAEAASVLPRDYGKKGILVTLTTYPEGQKESRLVAETDGHANWIRWTLTDD